MSNTKDNKSGATHRAAKACRVAYSLNETQPVICTIIDDQPLFYTDHEDTADERFIDDSDIFTSVSADPADDLAGLETLNEFVADIMFVTGQEFQAPETDSTAEQTEAENADAVLEEVIDILRHSRLACAYLQSLEEWSTDICYSPHYETALYDRNDNTIYINPHRDSSQQVLLLAREMRRAWQSRQGALLHPLHFHPDQSILVNRAQIADLSVNIVRICWELQLADIKEPWKMIESSSMSDLCRAFARESFLDFRSLNNGQAASAAFETWFLSSRCGTVDRDLIRQMLADHRGYIFGDRQLSKSVTVDLIMALGNMPFGKNYLVPYARTILDDPVFTDVRDRSNANFLWFIKFEQSFRDAERDLQATQSVNNPGDRQGDSRDKTERRIENEKTAEIVSLDHFKNKPAASGKRARNKSGGGTDFKPGSGE